MAAKTIRVDEIAAVVRCAVCKSGAVAPAKLIVGGYDGGYYSCVDAELPPKWTMRAGRPVCDGCLVVEP